jgi:hypothetical protein
LEFLEDRLVPSTLTYSQFRQLPISIDDTVVPAVSATAATGVGTQSAIQGTQLIGLDQAFANFPYRGAGYSVAVIDTGIDYTNPAFGNRVIAGWNFANNSGNYMDDNGHGTAVAGVIGSGDPSYTGMAPAVNLIALKVLDASGSGTFGAVADALAWVVAHQQQYHIVAVNMSLGAGDYAQSPYTFLDNDFQALVNEGVFIAVASGNDFFVDHSQQGLAYPAISPYVASVGAVWDGNYGKTAWQDGAIDYSTAVDQITSFTQRSPALDLLAPGAMVTSVARGGGYVTMAGTSLATPFVTGAAVLLHQELDALGEHNLAGELSILSIMQSTGAAIVDAGENANVTPTGLTFKRLNIGSAMIAVSGDPAPPVLSPIANQTMAYNQGSLTVTLSASDSNGAPLTFTAQATTTSVSLSISGNQLTIHPAQGYAGSFTVQVTVSDGLEVATQSFQVTVTPNPPPTLAAIPNQTMRGTQPLIVTLPGSDSDGDSLTYSAHVVGGAAAQAYQLKQQLGLLATTNYYTNAWGFQEKWLPGSGGQWYFILPDGELRQWAATRYATPAPYTLIATLDSSFYADPSLLWNAQPSALPIVSLSISGNQLTIQRPGTFTGTFQVQAAVSDGSSSATQTFQVTVPPDAPPVLAPIANQVLQGSQPLTIALSATDADGDSLTYSALVPGALAYQLKQQLGLMPAMNYYTNSWGFHEKWITGSGGQWYFILPDGELRQWAATRYPTPASYTLIANLDSSYYADPSRLWNAAATANPGLSIAGNQLTIQRPNGYTGSFQVQATVSDGVLSATQVFQVTVPPGTTPVLAAIANQTMHANQSLTIVLSGSDADGDSLTYSAQVVGAQAIQLGEQLGFEPTTNYYTNAWGFNEKWLQAKGGQWYFILPDGELREALGGKSANLAAYPLIANLGVSFYADPSQLWNVQAAATSGVTLSISGNQLTIQPPAGYTGAFQVQATVTDGQASASQTFQVTVTANAAPVLSAIANQSITIGQPLVVNLSGSDADGDSLTYSAHVLSSANSQAYAIEQQLGLTYGGSYFTNSWGLGEKWLVDQKGQWYFILSDGELRAWAGTLNATLAPSALIATLNVACFADPSLLWNAQPVSANPILQVNGNQLVIQATAANIGSFQIQAAVSDGVHTASQSFTLVVW